MRRWLHVVLLACVWLVATGHVGSPEVWYDGPAGPYSIRVFIRPPRVVPGLADVVVRVRGGAERVSVAPARFDTGAEGTPAPDIAKVVRGDPESFSAQLWLMTRGAYRIVVNIDGAHGAGSAVIPVTATATERLAMPRLLGGIMAGVLAFLLLGLITIVGAAVREGVLAPGLVPSSERLRTARRASAAATLVIGLLLLGGWRWWNAVDGWHRSRLDRPWEAEATTFSTNGQLALSFAITDSLWLMRRNEAWLQQQNRYPRASLIADHGKLMHMFLVRSDDLSGFAHVHPVSRDSITFDVLLPPLPPGPYVIYADIVEESGSAHTLVARTNLGTAATGPPVRAAPDGDPDDAAWSGPPLGSLQDSVALLDQGFRMRLIAGAQLVAGQETELRVSVLDSAGAAVPLEPYMGMPAHLMLQHQDGSVFVHLHPQGTISMAAQMQLAAGARSAAPHSAQVADGAAIVFPYAFPKPGAYRVWVQVQQNGAVRTGAFDLNVLPER